MFLRKMQIKSRPKPGFGMCVLTVAVMKTAKFFIQPEINLHGWSVLGMKMSFQLLADSIQFPLEGGFHGNFNIFQERPVDSSWQVTLCRSPRCGPLHLLCTSSQSRGRTALAASHDRITLSLYRSSHTNGLRLIEISLVLCCFHDRCCSLLVHSWPNMRFAAVWDGPSREEWVGVGRSEITFHFFKQRTSWLNSTLRCMPLTGKANETEAWQ